MPSVTVRTPYARIKSVDSVAGMTDFVNSGKHSLFVKRWDEGGWGVRTHTYSGQEETLLESYWDKSSQRPPVRSEEDSRSLRFEAVYQNMSEEQFSGHLARIRKLRPQFQAFLRSRARDTAARAAGYESYEQYTLAEDPKPELNIAEIDLYAASQSSDQSAIREFLDTYVSEEDDRAPEPKPEPSEHVNLGLSYAAHSRFYNDRFSQPIPARLLARSEYNRAGSYTQTEYTASAIGAVAQVPSHRSGGLAPTQWLPDREGYINREQGKGLFRIERAEVKTSASVTNEAVRMSRWPFEAYIAELDNDRPELVPSPAVTLSLRHVDPVQEEQWITPGSREWVLGKASETGADRRGSERRRMLAEQTSGMFAARNSVSVGPRDDLQPAGLRPPKIDRDSPEDQKSRLSRLEYARVYRSRPSNAYGNEGRRLVDQLDRMLSARETGSSDRNQQGGAARGQRRRTPQGGPVDRS
jgi:hypothetical protein